MARTIHIDDPSAKVQIHFRRGPREVAPCGTAPGKSWTHHAEWVTCERCRTMLARGPGRVSSGARSGGRRAAGWSRGLGRCRRVAHHPLAASLQPGHEL